MACWYPSPWHPPEWKEQAESPHQAAYQAAEPAKKPRKSRTPKTEA